MSPARAASAITTASAAVEMSTAAHASARSTISYSPVRPTGAADRAFPDQFDARGRKRIDELHQRVDISPDDSLARFHALDRGQRETRALGEFALIDLQQRARLASEVQLSCFRYQNRYPLYGYSCVIHG